MAELDLEYKKRLLLVYTYISQFTIANTYFIRNYIVGGAESDLGFMHDAVKIVLDTLGVIYTLPEALVLWDALWADVKADLNLLCDNVPYAEDEDIQCSYDTIYLERYQARVNLILLEAEVLNL